MERFVGAVSEAQEGPDEENQESCKLRRWEEPNGHKAVCVM